MSEKRTGRDWGDRRPFAVIRKFKDENGIKCAEVEADFWDGPIEPGERGEYVRHRWIEKAQTPIYDRRNGEIIGFTPRIRSSCSFEGEMDKALS